MKICKCSCHHKGVMHSIEWCYSCCSHPHRPYLNADGTIDQKDLDAMVEQSIKDWHKYRRENSIEYYPPKKKGGK